MSVPSGFAAIVIANVAGQHALLVAAQTNLSRADVVGFDDMLSAMGVLAWHPWLRSIVLHLKK